MFQEWHERYILEELQLVIFVELRSCHYYFLPPRQIPPRHPDKDDEKVAAAAMRELEMLMPNVCGTSSADRSLKQELFGKVALADTAIHDIF